jgi:hypothetical protein
VTLDQPAAHLNEPNKVKESPPPFNCSKPLLEGQERQDNLPLSEVGSQTASQRFAIIQKQAEVASYERDEIE